MRVGGWLCRWRGDDTASLYFPSPLLEGCCSQHPQHSRSAPTQVPVPSLLYTPGQRSQQAPLCPWVCLWPRNLISAPKSLREGSRGKCSPRSLPRTLFHMARPSRGPAPALCPHPEILSLAYAHTPHSALPPARSLGALGVTPPRALSSGSSSQDAHRPEPDRETPSRAPRTAAGGSLTPPARSVYWSLAFVWGSRSMITLPRVLQALLPKRTRKRSVKSGAEDAELLPQGEASVSSWVPSLCRPPRASLSPLSIPSAGGFPHSGSSLSRHTPTPSDRAGHLSRSPQCSGSKCSRPPLRVVPPPTAAAPALPGQLLSPVPARPLGRQP